MRFNITYSSKEGVKFKKVEHVPNLFIACDRAARYCKSNDCKLVLVAKC